MKRASNLTALVLLVACAVTRGLYIVPDLRTYELLAQQDPDKRLVDLESLAIPIDVRYATPDNFMKKTLYPLAKAYLRAPAAQALADVQRELAKEGLGIKVFDGYRPYRVTVAM